MAATVRTRLDIAFRFGHIRIHIATTLATATEPPSSVDLVFVWSRHRPHLRPATVSSCSRMTRNDHRPVVLLDAGGIFYIPDHRIALATGATIGFTVEESLIDEAHYRAALAFADTSVNGDPHHHFWDEYLQRYAEAIGCPIEQREHAVAALADNFAAVSIWQRVIPGSLEGLRALHDAGARIGIVSNHDGTIEAMLRRDGIAQVGRGAGVPVEVIIDSAVVGERKPGARIFEIAIAAMHINRDDPDSPAFYVGDMPAIDAVGARAARLVPVIMDPWGAHPQDVAYATTRSLTDFAHYLAPA